MIGIVGAGLSGLALALFLEEAGVPHLVLEGADRPGGVIRSGRVEGHLLDFGPQRTRVTPPVARMIRLLGLEDRQRFLRHDVPLFVYRKGRLRKVPFGAGELLRTDLLSVPGKLRLLAEPLTGAPRPDETVAAMATRKFGGEAYEAVVGPLFGGLYGSDPAEMYVRHALAETLGRGALEGSLVLRFLRGAISRSAATPATTFDEGMQELTDAMAARVGPRLRLATPVTELAPDTAGGWILGTGGGERIPVREVVLTLPRTGAAGLLAAAAPDAARRLHLLRENPLVMVHLHGEPGKLHGLGYQVAYGESLRSRGVTWNDAAFGRPGVYTAFLGGARDPEAVTLDDDRLGEVARTEFEAVTGCRTRVLAVSRTRIPSWDRSWEALDGLELPPGVHLCTNYESRAGIPGRLARAETLAASLAASFPGARPYPGGSPTAGPGGGPRLDSGPGPHPGEGAARG